MVKRTIIIFITLMLILTGCSSKNKEIEYIEKPVYVEVPVEVKPEIIPIKKPVYYISNIAKNSTPKEIAEAYVNTILQMKRYIQQLEDAITPFYKKEL